MKATGAYLTRGTGRLTPFSLFHILLIMQSHVVIVLLSSYFSIVAHGELAVRDSTLYWAGGPKHGLDESQAFCESVSHGLIPVLWNPEMRVLQWSLLEQTGEEFWVGAKFEGGKFVWGEGSRIDEWMWEGEQKCESERCGVTVQNCNHGIKLMVRDVKNKYRNLCRLWAATESDAILRIANLWKYMENSERVKMTKELPSQMIRVNTQRLQDLEQKIVDLTDEIRRKPAP